MLKPTLKSCAALVARRTRGLMPLLMLGALMTGGAGAQAATRTVTSLADDGSAGTLRAQVAAATAGDTIDFGVTGTIELNKPSIAIAKDLTISGPGAGALTISGNGAGNGGPQGNFSDSASIFRINNGVVGISGLRISDGTGDERLGGGIRMSGGTATLGNLAFSTNFGDSGGGVYLSGGSMVLDGCTFSGNNGPAQGGAIAMTGGTMTLSNSTLTDNNNFTANGVFASSSDGGAIYLGAGNLSINRTSISGNRGRLGGGIHQADGTLNIANSTLSGNTAQEVYINAGSSIYGWGGALFTGAGTVSIINSTISANRATGGPKQNRCGGGAIWNQGALAVANSTIVNNITYCVGGGILDFSGGGANISNSILAGNSADKLPQDSDFSGNSAVGDYNLIQRIGNPSLNFPSGTHNIYGRDALLGPLQNNGGPTRTHAPLPGSPVLNTGNPNFNASNLPFDQRGAGFPRVKDGRLDIGAVEGIEAQSGNSFVVNSLADTDDGVCGLNTSCTLREAINLVPSGGTITFSVTGTITLTGGELRILRNMSITGPTNAPGIVISGNKQSRIFTVGQERDANGATVTGSVVPSQVNFSTLTLRDGNGVGSIVNNNGGALFIDNPSPPIQVTVANCTFSGNSATSISGVTQSGNGGAIRNAGALTVTNSTFYGNSAGNNGGAIRNGASTTVTSSTISGNSAGTGRGGGIDNNGSTVNLSNTLIAGNSAPTGPDVGGVITSAGYNFVGKGEGNTGPAVTPATTPATFGPTPLVNGTNGNQIGSSAAPLNPQLGALANNGGPTQTMALLEGSPAINAGSNALVPSGVTSDQRPGYARIYDTTVDIGAFEVQPPPSVISLASPSAITVSEGNSGVANTLFTLTRSGDTSRASTVAYTLGGGNATAGVDYLAAFDSDGGAPGSNGGSPGIVNFGVGQTSATISVPVVGDYGLEVDETVTLTLSNATVATLGETTVLLTIQNDDSGLVVTTNSDAASNDYDNDNTLREAINSALIMASGTNPEITFASNVRGEILLGSALPNLTRGMTLTGPGAGLLNIRPAADGAFTVFSAQSSAGSTLSGLSISKGSRGISNGGTLTLSGCVVTGNSAIVNSSGAALGGGIFNSGTLTMKGCVVSNNRATNSNYGRVEGGGIYNNGTLLMTECLVLGNQTSNSNGTGDNGGGGISNGGGSLSMVNCTVSGNTSNGANSFGGGIYQGRYFYTEQSPNGTVTLANCTVSGNNAQSNGGGLYVGGGTFGLRNTIVAGNTSGGDSRGQNPDVSGAIASQGYNLIGNSSGAGGFTANGDQVGVNPMLGALADNGGPTQTIALSAGSPAINAGDPAFSGSGQFDQRGAGFPRVIGGRLDIGAFESSFVPPPSLFIGAASAPEGNTGNGSVESGTNFLRLPLTLSSTSTADVTVSYNTANGTATSGSDYIGTNNGSVTIPAGQTTGAIVVPILGDKRFEANETLTVTVTAVSNATVSASATATGTITNDDQKPTLSINSVSQNEGNSGTTQMIFTVNLSVPSDSNTVIPFSTQDGSATAGSDYVGVSNGSVTIPANQGSTTFSITINGDTTAEGDETFSVVLGDPTAGDATLSPQKIGVGTLLNDETAPAAATVPSGVSVLKSGFTRNRSTNRLVQTVVLQNSSGAAIAGPIYLAVDGLTGGTLYGAVGTTVMTAPTGSAYRLIVPQGNVLPTGSTLVYLEFVTSSSSVSFTPRVLQGPGTP